MLTNYYPLVNVYIAMKNHHYEWVNPLFLWPFSIATLNYQRVYRLYGYGSIPIDTIFRGMNIHLPAILM